MVFGTNVVVSTLLFETGRLSWLRSAWSGNKLRPVVNRSTVRELARVLSYPKFKLQPADRHELLAEYLPYAERFDAPVTGAGPVCGDAHDQVFVDLALASAAEYLVSGDRHIVALARDLAVTVLTPAECMERFTDISWYPHA